LDKKVSKYIGGRPIRLDGKPRASGIMDTVRQFLTYSCDLFQPHDLLQQIRAAIAHGIKVPPEFEDKSVVDVIVRHDSHPTKALINTT
jgi:acid phosphatase